MKILVLSERNSVLMVNRLFLIVFLITSFLYSGTAQIEGYVFTEDSTALPGASVMINGTTTGAMTNTNGYFKIRESPLHCKITVSFVGYKNQELAVSRLEKIKVYLNEEALEMPEVVITSGENPAIPIIRKAMARREEVRKIKDHYQATAYTKGVFLSPNSFQKLKSMGVVDSSEVMDSSGNVIFYLAETLTQVTKANGSSKEYILSSRRSGDPKGIALNFISLFNINFEESIIPAFGNLINPIGNAAFQYYDYRLEGSYYENGQKYYKITVLPKRTAEPVFQGAIYIVDGSYDLQQANLFVLGSSTNLPALDTIFIKQSYQKLDNYDKWVIRNQYFEVKGSFLFIKLMGYLSGFYNDYKVLPQDYKIEDKKTLIAFDPLAPKKSEDYWKNIRPMSLTSSELHDYLKRDSIAAVQDSPAYQDSVDRKGNRFRWKNTYGNYSFKRRSKGIYFKKASLLNSIRFDPVQGFSLSPELDFTKEWAESGKKVKFTATPSYGIADQRFKYEAGISFLGKEDRYHLHFNGGDAVKDYNNSQPLTPLFNSIICLAKKINYTRFYRSKFYTLSGDMLVHPDIRISLGALWEDRSLIPNHTDFSFFNKEAAYADNYPSSWGLANAAEVNSRVTELNWKVRWHPGTRFFQLPDSRIAISSAMPTFSLSGNHAVPIRNHDAQYNLLQFSVTGFSQRIYTLGTVRANVYSGAFIGAKPQNRIDYKDFSGHLLYIKESASYLNSFKDLPYYMHSTQEKYINWYAEWNLGGYLFNKIPLLRKTGFEEVFSCNGLLTGDPYSYLELGVGIDKIGWNVFRPFRFDYFWRLENGKLKEHTFTIGVNFNILLSLANTATN